MMRFITAHARSLAVSGCLVAIAGTGTAVALTHGGGPASASAAPTTTATTAPPQSTPSTTTKHHQERPHVKGTISSISPATWTLTTAKGAKITVDVGSATHYGTAKQPATVSSFSVGQTVVVFGERHDQTITAARILVPAAAHPTPTTTTPPSA